ncbi:16S rRNA m(7)G-527 methyltransferase [Octadecabacter temperatus]|uniref:Ribosomal RNA small subunit methyltransferase G n=1 Tax=Octadecabacter temperatus TaxID=1458307 RepID=A0A0K0Y9W4_9RHOB|nr:16S rRNA (guanine(527)-N(7))-methyltransferase RsmG [Octadecabacter temperatus]AKS47719.1 Ribosomal RNA small subunit methyltransferase G [Octadecabacter temperatus]SIO39442.1 16S rRNA m(7)G-527 methyltransferase [Octadecabacter temperatus]
MSSENILVGGKSVSRETFQRLEQLSALITKWTKSINLISPSSIPEIWERHIVDSAQIYQIARSDWKNWVDLGSGGGLPALVVAVLDQERRPITLVESDQRKCLFLNTAKRELDLNLVVVNKRIEKTDLSNFDVMSARALAALPELLTYAVKYLKPEGQAILPKGARFQQDLDQASQGWQFDVMTHASLTSPESRILEVSRIYRRES